MVGDGFERSRCEMKDVDADLIVANARAQFEEAARLLRMEVADATGDGRMYGCSMLRTALQRFREAELTLLRVETLRAWSGQTRALSARSGARRAIPHVTILKGFVSR